MYPSLTASGTVLRTNVGIGKIPERITLPGVGSLIALLMLGVLSVYSVVASVLLMLGLLLKLALLGVSLITSSKVSGKKMSPSRKKKYIVSGRALVVNLKARQNTKKRTDESFTFFHSSYSVNAKGIP